MRRSTLKTRATSDETLGRSCGVPRGDRAAGGVIAMRPQAMATRTLSLHPLEILPLRDTIQCRGDIYFKNESSKLSSISRKTLLNMRMLL